MGFPGRGSNHQVSQESPSMFRPKQPKRTPVLKDPRMPGGGGGGRDGVF